MHRPTKEARMEAQAKVVFHKLKHLQTGQNLIIGGLATTIAKSNNPDHMTVALNELAAIIVNQQSTIVGFEETNLPEGKIALTAKFINFKFDK